MELKNINTFIKVAELGNITRASAELGYAQSTVTMQIQQLENELHANLFERNGKRIRLSAAGRDFLKYAYPIAKYEAMAIDHFHQTTEPEGTLNIGIMETICSSDYTNFFYDFLEKYPKIALHLEVVTASSAIDYLEKGLFDVIFLLDKKIIRPEWKTIKEFPIEISFFCSSSHPLAKQKEVSMERLLEERFILTEKGYSYRQVFENDLTAMGKKLECVTEIGHTSYIIKAVSRQLGIGLLPTFTLLEEQKRGTISLIPVKNYKIQLPIQVIYNSQHRITLPLKTLFEEVEHFDLSI